MNLCIHVCSESVCTHMFVFTISLSSLCGSEQVYSWEAVEMWGQLKCEHLKWFGIHVCGFQSLAVNVFQGDD